MYFCNSDLLFDSLKFFFDIGSHFAQDYSLGGSGAPALLGFLPSCVLVFYNFTLQSPHIPYPIYCFIVTPKACKNLSPNCASWARSGYCRARKHKEYMVVNCPRACGFCGPARNCKDKSSNCKAWGRSGYCQGGSYKPYMIANCRKTCKLC